MASKKRVGSKNKRQLKTATKRRNMFYQNKKQETTGIGEPMKMGITGTQSQRRQTTVNGVMSSAMLPGPQSPSSLHLSQPKPNQVGTVMLYGVPIVSLVMENVERLCLAQISNTLLKTFSYNEIHNRRVALGITCVQCTPLQLEMLRRAGAMPVSSRRCGMITRREAERLCKSFLGDNTPPRLPDDFAFAVHHECAWGCRGAFIPARYNSSRAKCIKCSVCGLFFSPNKFIFHSHRSGPNAKYVQPDAANFNSWRRHMRLTGTPPEEVTHAWEDVKAMFNGGTRKRLLGGGSSSSSKSQYHQQRRSPSRDVAEKPTGRDSPRTPLSSPLVVGRVPPLPLVMDYVWKHPFPAYPLPWLPPAPLLLPPPHSHQGAEGRDLHHTHQFQSAFTPVYSQPSDKHRDSDSEENVDIETCPEDDVKPPTHTPWTQQMKLDPVHKSGSDNEINQKTSEGSANKVESVWLPQLPLDCSRPSESFYRQQVVRHLHMMRELVSPADVATAGFRTLVTSPQHSPLPEMSQNALQVAGFPPQVPPRRAPFPELARKDNLSPIDCTGCNQQQRQDKETPPAAILTGYPAPVPAQLPSNVK